MKSLSYNINNLYKTSFNQKLDEYKNISSTDTKVIIENILGEEGKGHVIVMNGLDSERAMIAPICLGISERALDISIEYSKIREQFGKPISSFQMIQSKIAEMYTSVQAIKAIVYSVLSECDNTDEKEFGRGKIHMNTAASVMFASSTTNEILDKAVQIHGGMGYMWESEANRLYRASKLLDIGAGTTEVRKMIITYIVTSLLSCVFFITILVIGSKITSKLPNSKFANFWRKHILMSLSLPPCLLNFGPAIEFKNRKSFFAKIMRPSQISVDSMLWLWFLSQEVATLEQVLARLKS